uniref:Tetraspanin n=1 Tax=Cacopsylla melanoneura TaxID=428564 RepID=A0A8D8XP07_9HEMI
MAKTIGQAAVKLEKQINGLKYTLFCLNVIAWILAAVLLSQTIYSRLDTEFQDFIDKLELWCYYWGLYVLMFVALIILVSCVFSCAAIYQEIAQLLQLSVAVQGLCFLLLLVGVSILEENSTVNSRIQPILRDILRQLIMNSRYETVSVRLNSIQETIGCCGADGATDYIHYRQPLPSECRDTVTGNPFFHGCVDEMTWLLQDKSSWIAGISITLSALHVGIGVLTLILIQALKKESSISFRS